METEDHRRRGERENRTVKKRLTEYKLLRRGEHIKGECDFVLIAFTG